MSQIIIITGNLGRDPESRYTPSGQAVTSFSIADSRTYTTAGGETVKETTWFKVSVWGKQAEACNQYLKKGSKVYVEGRMTPDKATGAPRIYTKGDGTPASSFEVNASTVQFLSPKSEQAETPFDAAGSELGDIGESIPSF